MVVLVLIGSCRFLIPEPEVVVVVPTPAPEDVVFDYAEEYELEMEAQRQRQEQQQRELDAIQAALGDVMKIEAAGPDAPPPKQLDHYRKQAQDPVPPQDDDLRKKPSDAKKEGGSPSGAEMRDGVPDER